MNNIPQHVAIIMDGNGRWAKKRRLPAFAGHNAGMKAMIEIVRHSTWTSLSFEAFILQDRILPDTTSFSFFQILILSSSKFTTNLFAAFFRAFLIKKYVKYSAGTNTKALKSSGDITFYIVARLILVIYDRPRLRHILLISKRYLTLFRI